VTCTYDRTGARASMTDQNGSVHEYDYDKQGRRTADRVTTLASGVDNSVLRIETAYEVRGLVEKVTSYDAASSGNVVNEVEYAYNDFGQLITEYEAHDGAVNTGTTPKVQYVYADGSANTIRSTGFTYPNGNTLTHGYGTANSDDDLLSRVIDLTHSLSPSDPITYSYFGLPGVYKIDYTDPQVDLDYATGTGSNPYAGFDRFGRVIDMNWENYSTSTSLDQFQYGYDRASSRTWRKNLVAPAGFDELYAYDGMHRLQSAERGQLSSDKSRIESDFEFHQAWNLDATGNWSDFEQFDQDDASQALVQQRTHNAVNEITGIGESVGSQWGTPSHDRNGNMTIVPQPSNPTISYDAIFDAWNRLIKLTDSSSSDVVSVYLYDGVNRRITTGKYDAGVLVQTRHYYFNNRWQTLEERIDASTNAERQYVWGIQYIDQLHIRMRDANGDGTINEKLYAIQDGNWNVMTVCANDGVAIERYGYTAYGISAVMSGDFLKVAGTGHSWDVTYQGRSVDLASGLMDFRNRCYSSSIGRFLVADPQGYRDGMNQFEFAGSSPLIRNDPLGLSFVCFGLTAAAEFVIGLGMRVNVGTTGAANPVPVFTRTGTGPFGFGFGGSIALYGCVGHSPKLGWECIPCGSLAVYVFPLGFGVWFSASLGPSIVYGFDTASNKPSDGPGVSVGLSAGYDFDVTPAVPQVTVDIDIPAKTVTIGLPKLGVSGGWHLAVKVSGTCTACDHNVFKIPSKLGKCLGAVAAALNKAAARIAKEPVGEQHRIVKVGFEGFENDIDPRYVPPIPATKEQVFREIGWPVSSND